MANSNYTDAEWDAYRERLKAIEDLLPINYSKPISKKLKVSRDVVRNVKIGKTYNLKVVAELEKLAESKKEVAK
jgi:hypothetical protein